MLQICVTWFIPNLDIDVSVYVCVYINFTIKKCVVQVTGGGFKNFITVWLI